METAAEPRPHQRWLGRPRSNPFVHLSWGGCAGGLPVSRVTEQGGGSKIAVAFLKNAVADPHPPLSGHDVCGLPSRTQDPKPPDKYSGWACTRTRTPGLGHVCVRTHVRGRGWEAPKAVKPRPRPCPPPPWQSQRVCILTPSFRLQAGLSDRPLTGAEGRPLRAD